MENKTITKAELMASILKNPKLSRTFRDAMASPIGSTKRDQAKSVLSIIKKVGGMHDGMGGPMDMSISQPTSSAPSGTSAPDYSNIMIFPSAPAFKNKSVQPPVQSSLSGNTEESVNKFDTAESTNTGMNGMYDGKGGPTDLFSPNSSSNTYSTPDAITTPANSWPTLSGSKAVSNPAGTTVNGKFYANLGNSDSAIPTTAPTPNISSPASSNPQVKALQESLNTKNAGQPGWVPLVTDGILGAKTKAAQNFTPTTGSTTPTGSSTPTGPTGVTTADAQKYVNNNEGSYAFGEDLAKSNFGGKNLTQIITDNETKLKKDFNLQPLELQLSNLKGEQTSFVPTLNAYIQGKDQYLSFIDKMIDQTNGELLKQDMGDPNVAARYNNYLNYLTTLKGRQTQRYGGYLNSAVADFNSEITKVQDNYNSIYKNFTDALTQKDTLDQNTYNNLMTRGASLYTELQSAPDRLNNRILAEQQIKENNLIALNGGVKLFTQTQLNKGASSAGMNLGQFIALDPDVKNFFVNEPNGIDPNTNKSVPLGKIFESALSEVASGTSTAESVTSEINDSNLPQPVKDYFIKKIPAAPVKKDNPWYNPFGWGN